MSRRSSSGTISRAFYFADQRIEVVCDLQYTLDPPTPRSWDDPGDNGNCEYDLFLDSVVFHDDEHSVAIKSRDLPKELNEVFFVMANEQAGAEYDDIWDECARDAYEADQAALEHYWDCKREERLLEGNK